MKQDWWRGQTRFGISPGLSRIEALLARLDDPHRAYPVVHVAGTNGKGSVSVMVAHALASQGLTVGLYVSPDLGVVNERVMINGVPISEDLWDAMANEIEDAGAGLPDMPTWFETVTALAFLAFLRCQVDVAVVEVGLGGRLDATNVVPPPLLSVITPVARDHTRYLGSTIDAIAREKAGIIKAGSELVLAHQPYPQARKTIWERASELGVPVYEPERRALMREAGPVLTTADGLTVQVPLLGAYQAGNLETAWRVIERLMARGMITGVDRVVEALAQVRWPGRFEIVSHNPLVVVDGAHNPHGMAGLVQTLRQKPWDSRRWRVVFGVFADKDGEEMLRIISAVAHSMVLTLVPGQRGRDPNSLKSLLPAHIPVRVERDPVAALQQERGSLRPGEGVVVTGSLALLAELRRRSLVLPDPRLSKPGG